MSFRAMNRRSFLETAATVGAATLFTSRFGWAAGEHKIDKVAVQLYSVRDLMKDDFEGTIAKVAQIGYKEVEFAGYFGRTPQQVRAVLDKNGLTAPSTHVQYDELDEKFPKVIEDSKTIGLEYIVCPWIPEELRKSPDIWKQASEKFNKCGEQTNKAGIQFGYHNHWFEFLPVNGKLPYDQLLADCDPKLVKMELDLCWITAGGSDPVKYFEKYPGRFPLVHVKDIKKLPKVTQAGSQDFGSSLKDITEVGSGMIDWKRIFAHSEQAGIKHYIVEHDNPKQPLESIKTSYEYLKNLRW
ncbi:MAG TPA: sugar phosphate isomerase/epimerase [Candidatus Sulfotelmatobacter sp.]|nr:sugar phosphate isomerase/epimerase [Candidatus Sulfotelmatobacter sp.]